MNEKSKLVQINERIEELGLERKLINERKFSVDEIVSAREVAEKICVIPDKEVIHRIYYAIALQKAPKCEENTPLSNYFAMAHCVEGLFPDLLQYPGSGMGIYDLNDNEIAKEIIEEDNWTKFIGPVKQNIFQKIDYKIFEYLHTPLKELLKRKPKNNKPIIFIGTLGFEEVIGELCVTTNTNRNYRFDFNEKIYDELHGTFNRSSESSRKTPQIRRIDITVYPNKEIMSKVDTLQIRSRLESLGYG